MGAQAKCLCSVHALTGFHNPLDLRVADGQHGSCLLSRRRPRRSVCAYRRLTLSLTPCFSWVLMPLEKPEPLQRLLSLDKQTPKAFGVTVGDIGHAPLKRGVNEMVYRRHR